MGTYALIQASDGVVVNRIVLDDLAQWQCPAGFELVVETSKSFEIGGAYIGGTYTPPYVEPPPAVVLTMPAHISDRQFFQALATKGAITQAEALAAVKTGDIPSSLQSFVDTLSPDMRFSAEMMISGAVTFERSHPMTEALATGMGWTTAQLDDLWRVAATL